MHKKQAAIWMTLLLSVFVLSPVMALADSHLQGEELEAGAKESSPSRIDLAPNAVSALLMDADTGTILYEKNAHDRLPPGEHHENHDDASDHGGAGSGRDTARMKKSGSVITPLPWAAPRFFWKPEKK